MSNPSSLPRRTFLKTVGLAGAGLALGRTAFTQTAAPLDLHIPKRKFGRHDEMISSLGMGGHTLALAQTSRKRRGSPMRPLITVTFFDNAWEYHDGRGEEWMGRRWLASATKCFS